MTSQGMFTSLSVDQNSATPYTDATKWRRPDKPRVKRPLNPFMVWSQIERHKIIESSPDVHHAQVSKLLGKRWKSLSVEKKAPFIKEAERLRRLHRAEFPDYKYKPRRRKKTAHFIAPEDTKAYTEDTAAENSLDDENIIDMPNDYQSPICESNGTTRDPQVMSNYSLCHQQQPPLTQEPFYCPISDISKEPT